MVQVFLQLSLEMEKFFTETSGTVHSVVDHPSCLTMDFRGMSAPALEASPPNHKFNELFFEGYGAKLKI